MDATPFTPPGRVAIVAGKGGVGKTTVSAALARLAAQSGFTTLIVEVEGQSGLPALFGRTEPLSYQEAVLLPAGPGSGEVRARSITPDEALIEYLEDRGMQRISQRLVSTGTLDVVATAVPGIKDILVLGKVKQLETQSAAGGPGQPDFIIVDAPAAGHAVSFLASAFGLLDAAATGPIRAQALDVIELLGDPARCQVMLVTLPEETPVNEAIETAFLLEDQTGVRLAPIVVNALWPELLLPGTPGPAVSRVDPATMDRMVRAAQFRLRRQELQAAQVSRLAERLPLPQLHLPQMWVTELGPNEIQVLADALGQQLASGPQ